MNTSELKISVVVPVYNCEKYIERAIESVIKQTYDNWELIIVNDGSKDSSLQIAQKFAGKDARIKVIDRENRGVSVARNIGIDEASGDLLMFLDADDWFEEKAFETVTDNWDETAQMLLFDYWDVPQNQNRRYQGHFKENEITFGERGDYSIDDLELTVSGFYRKENSTVIQAPWGKAFSVAYLKKKQTKFPENVFNCEDQVFNLRAIDEMTYVRYIAKPIYCYRINLESVTFAAYQKNGERLVQNVILRDECVKDIFLKKKDRALYENAYYNYLYDGVKIILWWLADERDKTKKELGRKFCCSQAKEVKKHLCSNYSFTDKVLLDLCVIKCFGCVECIVRMRKIAKRILNIR